MEDRRELIEQMSDEVMRWTVKIDGISVSISADGEADTRNLTTLLRDNPKALEELSGGLPRDELAERMHRQRRGTCASCWQSGAIRDSEPLDQDERCPAEVCRQQEGKR